MDKPPINGTMAEQPSSHPVMPQLQRENATVEREKVDPRSARNLLRKVFKKGWEPLPTKHQLKREHAQVLLDTPIGRDFSLITTAGVEFKVHSAMLIGGSKMLQEGLFPGATTPASPPTFANLPPHFPPILIDRLITFIYTSDYTFGPPGCGPTLQKRNFTFYNATHIPDTHPPSPATTALVNIRDYAFHLHMYALGCELDYPALKAAAHAKIVDIMVFRCTHLPSEMLDLIDMVFVDGKRICKDEEKEGGVLGQVCVAAVLAHEGREWTPVVLSSFTSLISGHEYAAFRTLYEKSKVANGDLLSDGPEVRRLAEQRRKERFKARSTLTPGVNLPPRPPGSGRDRVAKSRKDRRDTKMGAGKVGKVVEQDRDGDLEMEVD